MATFTRNYELLNLPRDYDQGFIPFDDKSPFIAYRSPEQFKLYSIYILYRQKIQSKAVQNA